MSTHGTARSFRITEHHKARARLVLLTVIGLICPPLAGVRSVGVWIFYALFLVGYSLWSLRLVHSYSTDRHLGYLLAFTDAAIILPLLVWSSMRAMGAVLLTLCVLGFVYTFWADRARTAIEVAWPGDNQEQLRDRGLHAGEGVQETSLERALRVRLRVFEATQTRFGLVVLRVLRFEEIATYYGEESATRVLSTLARRGLHLLGADGQHFVLPGGRLAFVFCTGTGDRRIDARGDGIFEMIDPYDLESFAMILARRACEHLADGHRVECVVGWASAPADGLDPEDLLYAAESGAQSTDAFRRVVGAGVQATGKTRAVAG